MSGQSARLFAFGPYCLDPEQRLLYRSNAEVPLTPKLFETLCVLVEHHGRVVTKDELMNAVWPDTAVEENNLTQSISRLRKLLADGAANGEFIETLPRRGYRFVVPVVESGADEPDVLLHSAATVRAVTEEKVENEPAASGSPDPLMEGRRRSTWLVAALATASIALVVMALMMRGAANRAIEGSRETRIERLTGSGRAVAAAISPDGQHIGFVSDASGRQSLWLRQIATESDVQLAPPAAIDYWGITFSPDGQYIYYVAWERNARDAALYRIPLLGGLPRRLIDGVGNPISFSLDGRRIAFTSENRLMSASADGSDCRALYQAASPEVLAPLLNGPAWSPTGGSIVLATANDYSSSGRQHRIIDVDVRSGATRTIHQGPWLDEGQIAWMRDASGLLMTARDRPFAPRQIWHISYPDGRSTNLSNDLFDYGSISVTRDNAAIAAVQTHMVSELWVRDPSGGEHRLASEVGDRSGAEGFAWTPDDEIVYPVRSTEHLNLWRVPASGGLPRQVTIGPGNNFHPIVSPDGRYLVFASDRAGSIRLWRMPLSGGNAVALTSGHEEVRPSMAGEGRWIVYQQGHGWGRHTVWKVPTAGGEAVEVVHSSAIRPAVSPDEKMIAYFAMDGRGWYIAVMSLFGGPPLHTFPIPAIGSRVLRWMPDGRGLAYVDDRDDVSNIWLQRIDGGPPLQLARFTGGDIVAFDWSPDGRQLAYLRVTRSSDVVRLRNAVRPKALQ